MGSTVRAAFALPFLWFGAFLGLMAVAGLDTCTGGSADPLFMGYFVLALNVVGFLFLGTGTRLWLLAMAALVPAIAASFYTVFSAKFAMGVSSGMTACTALLGEEFPVPDGSEVELAALWIMTSVLFWIGLVISFRNSLRLRGKKVVEDD